MAGVGERWHSFEQKTGVKMALIEMWVDRSD